MRKALASVLFPLSTLFVLLAFAVSGCTTHHDQLVRSHHAFDENNHERTLGLLRALEPDVRRLPTNEQAQYAYLRGMTDYRIGHRFDARHWLAIASAYDEATPGTLPADWKLRMTEALAELNGVVYTEGISELGKPKREGAPSASVK